MREVVVSLIAKSRVWWLQASLASVGSLLILSSYRS